MSPTTGRGWAEVGWTGLGWAGLGWSPPAALFVHIVNIKFHNTFAFTVVTRPGVAVAAPSPAPGQAAASL